jgi:hypothetical protein
MVELETVDAGSCCSPGAQATCCGHGEKAPCCGEGADAGCGCDAGRDSKPE